MNKALTAGFMSIALSVFVAAVIPPTAHGQGIFQEIMRRMDKNNKSLETLRADVRMEKLNSQLGEADVTTGTTSYLPRTAKRQMFVRIDWTRPIEEHLVIIGDRYDLYRPRLKQRYQGSTSDVKNGNRVPGNALAFISMSRSQLQANYYVGLLPDEMVAGAKTWHLELTPKTKTSYKSAELWIDTNGMPIQAKIIEMNNDTTTVLLTNLQKNVKIIETDFKLDVPAGVKVLKG
jgi:outer membrane lipoprotein-sorting protein